jgi:hypothetical protein
VGLQGQTITYAFEDAGALTGWVRNDGEPLAVGPGASGTGALAVSMAEPAGDVRAYHPIPFEPTKAYRYSTWSKSSDPELTATMRLAWVNFSTGMTIYTDTYYLPCGYTGWKTTGVHPHRLPADDFSALPNVQFCIVLELGGNASGTVWFDDLRVTRSDPANTAFVGVNVMLGGAYVANSGIMTNALRNATLLPTTEPYTALGHPPAGGGMEQAPTAWWGVATLDGPVDWVRVELRSAVDPAVIVAARHGLVNRTGNVTEVDGCTAMGFAVPAGNYYVAVQHRNHLGVMTAAPVAVSPPSTVPWSPYSSVNFWSASTPTWGTEAQKVGDATYNYRVLWPGDTNGDGIIKYTGTDNDRDPILMAIGGSTPTASVPNVYTVNDVNMDGTVRYTGQNNDRDIILTSVGGAVPTATRTAQLP